MDQLCICTEWSIFLWIIGPIHNTVGIDTIETATAEVRTADAATEASEIVMASAEAAAAAAAGLNIMETDANAVVYIPDFILKTLDTNRQQQWLIAKRLVRA